MIYTGLVSVTFRKLSPTQIVNPVSKVGLQGIEWGGDIHVPTGDIYKAREVLKIKDNKKSDHFAMLEFIKEESEEQFFWDAAVLKDLILKCL